MGKMTRGDHLFFSAQSFSNVKMLDIESPD